MVGGTGRDGRRVARVGRSGPVAAGEVGVSRRRALQASAAGLAAVALGQVALPSPGVAAAGLTRADPTTTVVWNPLCSYFSFPPNVALPLIQDATGPFLAKHPGLRLKSAGVMLSTGTTVAAILAGSGPDVFPDNTVAPYTSQHMVLDLAPYMSQDNIPTSLFATSQIAKYTSAQGQVFMLPSYTGATALIVNESLLDEDGLTYPKPDWTYLQWTDMFRAVARKTTAGQRYGTTLFDAYTSPSAFYFHGFGASLVSESNPARCGLDQPGGLECATWVYELLHDNLAFFSDGGQAAAMKSYGQGLVVAPHVWQQRLFLWPNTLGGTKWNFYPMPLWPVRPASFTNSDFWAINASTKVPEAAWELLKWLTVDGTYSRLFMRFGLTPPNLKSLWPEWERVVLSVAPIYRGKNLGVFGQYVLGDEVYPGRDFAYQSETARSFLSAGMSQIWASTVSPELGIRQTVQRVNAFETAAEATSKPLPPGLIDQFPQAPRRAATRG